MTGIVFPGVSSANYFDNDLRLLPPEYLSGFSPDASNLADLQWPRGRLQGQDIVSVPLVWDLIWWEWNADLTGAENKFMVIGIARDNSGAVVSGATVKLYRTTTDEMVGQTVSDGGGAYSVGTPYSGSHYVVAYKAGSPDVAGTTVNNLTGV